MDKTFLTLRDVSVKLGVSEKTVYRMLTDNQIPFAVKIGGQWRFRRDAIAEWIAAQGGSEPALKRVNHQITLHQALDDGAILYRVHGRSRDEVIEELLAALPYAAALDVNAVKVSLLSRESVVSSSIKGIAFLQPAADRPYYYAKTVAILAHLEEPRDFRAIDHAPAEALFLIIPANATELALVDMRLRRLAMDEDFLAHIKGQPVRKDTLEWIATREKAIFGN